MAQPETILKGLPKYELYRKLDNKDDNHGYSIYCTYIDYLDSTYNGITELCSMYARNLITLSNVLNEISSVDERCRYINFWIHSRISKNFGNQWKHLGDSEYILLKFLSIENNIPENLKNNCRFHYYRETDLNLWIKLKDFFDYNINYDKIKDNINSNDSCEIYNKYMDYITTTHEEYKNECCNDSSPKCPYNLKIKEWCERTYSLPKLNCSEYSQNSVEPLVDVKGPDLSQDLASGRSDSVGDASLKSGQSPHDSTSMDNSDYYIKLAVSLSLLGIFSTFFFLYKFTTVGTWIRHNVLQKKKININLDEETKNLIENDSIYPDTNIYSDDFNITYQP
ncbi:PIR Superfamily Protein [Plasmodium ovale wallikeri]|uniref:PIR Superfamily Protein n=1 Tax=Plasmodium ovale wallikeri TaxID=864142 RepID=A0A1A9AN64_PLAOA|nr:PIR Superfamily Protein [Plasmodium ovale wallikeri]SBT57663.1 PIR Superfamily Protein [Plasmodium ovale wallikeri]